MATKKKAAAEPENVWSSLDRIKGIALKARKIFIEEYGTEVWIKPISGNSMRSLRRFHVEAKKAEKDENAGIAVFDQMDSVAEILANTYCKEDGSPLGTAEEWGEFPFDFMMKMVGAAVTGGTKKAEAKNA